MYALSHTIALSGIEATPILCEVQIQNGLPSVQIVGLPSKAVGESRDRIRSAFSSIGLSMPAKRITINLVPAGIKKEGTHYDLPIALAILSALNIIPQEKLNEYIVMGELSLNGNIQSVPGNLIAALQAKKQNKSFICAYIDGEPVAWIKGINLFTPKSLLEIIEGFQERMPWLPMLHPPMKINYNPPKDIFQQVIGQHQVIRGLLIAAAGGHNVLMNGPPGSGKSLLARSFQHLLPPMIKQEIIECAKINSITGIPLFNTQRPFRSPHHTTSSIALIGGGAPVRPGEVTLAHNGVLFLDELPEFSRHVLEALRQPLEDRIVTIARVHDHVTFPSRFQLIAAMNPCRCGTEECTRGHKCREMYESRISEPLYDRFDIYMHVKRVSMKQIHAQKTTPNFIDSIIQARKIQYKRNYVQGVYKTNADLTHEEIKEHITLKGKPKQLLDEAYEKLQLTLRGYHKVMKVAQTIADLEQSAHITEQHIAEALQYRRVRAINI